MLQQRIRGTARSTVRRLFKVEIKPTRASPILCGATRPGPGGAAWGRCSAKMRRDVRDPPWHAHSTYLRVSGFGFGSNASFGV